jgi:hypothetical protein
MLSLSPMNAYRWCLFPADEARRIAANIASCRSWCERKAPISTRRRCSSRISSAPLGALPTARVGRADLNRSDTNSRNRSDTNSTLRLCWAGSVCRPGRIGSPGALPPLASGLPSTRPVRSLGARIKNENVLARASTGDIPSVDRCCDSPSPCRRRRYRRGTHRWPCRRNDYRSRSHRATLLSAATGLCGSRALLLLDAWRTGMGWISGRLDLSFG